MSTDEKHTVIDDLSQFEAELTKEDKSWQRICSKMIQHTFEMNKNVKDALTSALEPILVVTQAQAGIIMMRSPDAGYVVEIARKGLSADQPIVLSSDANLDTALLDYLDPGIERDHTPFSIVEFGTKESDLGLVAVYSPGAAKNDRAMKKSLDFIKAHLTSGIHHTVNHDESKRRDLLAKASLVHLGKAMGSTLDIKRLARQITQAAMAIVEADLCDILLLKDGSLEFQIASGVNKILKGFGNVPLKKDPAAGIVERGRPMVISNIRSKSRFHERPWLNREQFKSYIGVPIKQDDQVIGVLEAFSTTKSKFTNNDLRIFQSFAGPVAASLQNIKFFEETRKKADELKILHTHISRIVAENDIDKMMKEIVDAARAAVGSLMAAAALFDPKTGRFEHRTSNIDSVLGEPGATSVAPGKVSQAAEVYEEILRTGKAVRLADIRLHNGRSAEQADKTPSRGFLGVPLVDQDKNPCGVVMVSFKKDGSLFTEADEEVLTTLANQASIAIQNAHLYRQLDYRARGLNYLFAVSQKINEYQDIKKIQKAVVQAVSKFFGAKSACIALYDKDNEKLVISNCLVKGEAPVSNGCLEMDPSMEKALFTEKKPIIIDSSEIGDQLRLDDKPFNLFFDSFVGIPLVVHNRPVGVLGVSMNWPEDSWQSSVDLELLQVFANKVAIAIDNSRLYEEALSKAENLAATLEVSRIISGEIGLVAIYKGISQAIKKMYKINHGCIFITDPFGDRLDLAYKWGVTASATGIRKVLSAEGNLIKKAFYGETHIVLDDLDACDAMCKEHIVGGGKLRSAVIIPLVVKGKARGVITLFSKEPGFFTEDRLSIINIFTNQFAVAIRNNQLYRRVLEEEVARREAEFSVELLEERAKNAIVIERTTDGIFMVDPDFRIAVFNPALEQITGKSADQVIGRKCYEVFKDVFVDGRLCERCPMCTVECKHDEKIKTNIRLKSGETRFVEVKHSLIDHAGRKAAIGSVRDISKEHQLEIYQHDLRIATEVQKNILPHVKPEVDGLDIGFMCQPAKQIGGDYFDFIPLGNDKLGIAIGDVAGKSLPAALLVSMHKYILRSATANTHSVISPLRALNQILWEDTSPEVFVTTIYGTYDPSTSTFVYANAGHLPPLLYSNGATSYLWTPQTPLGIHQHLSVDQQQVRMKDGDVLVLLSDGVTDIRNSRGDCYGFQRLRRLVKRNAHLGGQELADLIYEETVSFSTGELIDDFTIVVLKCTKEGAETNVKELMVTNKPIAVNDVRKFVSEQLKQANASKLDVSDILVSVCEAVTNCVLHGQSPDGEDNNIRVSCALEDGTFSITIIDNGIGYNPNLSEWRPPDLVRDRGRGIFLMRELMDGVEFSAGDRGSKVIMTKKVNSEKK